VSLAAKEEREREDVLVCWRLSTSLVGREWTMFWASRARDGDEEEGEVEAEEELVRICEVAVQR
jgi:hypothetical protein